MTAAVSDVYPAPLRVDEIFADPAYQRALDVARARRMAATWDRRLASMLEVSDRGEDHEPRYAVIDGQHRWGAAQLLDPPRCWWPTCIAASRWLTRLLCSTS